MESREDAGGIPPIVAHTPEEESTSITAAMRDGHSMAGTASADGESSTESLGDDDGSAKENLRYPASGKLAKTILSYAENEQLIHRRRRETTCTDTDSDSDEPREWKELSRANGMERFAETAALRKADGKVTEVSNETERGQEDEFSNIGCWGDPLEIAQTRREKKTRDMSQGTVIGNLPPVPFDPEMDSPAHVCFQCWKPGHGWPRCPKGR